MQPDSRAADQPTSHAMNECAQGAQVDDFLPSVALSLASTLALPTNLVQKLEKLVVAAADRLAHLAVGGEHGSVH
jgi:hypothetical protein